MPLAQAQLCRAAFNVAETLRLAHADCCLAPFFHVHGVVASLLASLHAGASLGCVGGFEEERFATLREFAPTWYAAVPTIHRAILRAIEALECPPMHTLRFARSSSPALPARVAARLESVLGVPVIEAYNRSRSSDHERAMPMETLRFAHIEPPLEGLAPRRTLAAHEVDVWAFSLAASADEIERWSHLLSGDERDRAGRFKRHGDRDTFIVAHGVVRRLLGAYCAMPPPELRFGRSPDGKPRLDAPPADPALRFNLAHSGERALLAVSRSTEVGVDLERARDDLDVLGLAARYFSTREYEVIAAAPDAGRTEAFLRHWVAKEAVLKARGSGLAYPTDAFTICFDAGGATASVASPDPAISGGDWHVGMLPMPAGWFGASCTQGERNVRLRDPARDAL